ncbi:hypothetical protein NL676_019876 [Syzygium grande]|nr:hypothetical protein NL676_019876 [Syzygium grande]
MATAGKGEGGESMGRKKKRWGTASRGRVWRAVRNEDAAADSSPISQAVHSLQEDGSKRGLKKLFSFITLTVTREMCGGRINFGSLEKNSASTIKNKILKNQKFWYGI